MKYVVTLNGKSYEVDVDELNEAVITDIYDAAKNTPAPVSAPSVSEAKPAPVADGSGEAVKAPMPGTILSVNVTDGQRVSEGDVIMILEAMKMENEIVAPKSGAVSGIKVGTGTNVATDDILAYIN